MKISPKIFLLSILTLFYGCELKPQLGELVNDMVIQTNYDNSVDFTSYTTYTMPIDTLGRVSGSAPDTLIVTEYAEQVTAVLRNNLNGRGYSRVEKNQNPDIGVTAYIVDDLNVFQSVNYYNYYPSYYGYYSPYYYNYPQVSTYAYNTAVLVIELVDLKNTGPQGQFKVIWTAYMGDVLTSVDPFEKSVEAVNQAFVQSPYLKK